VVEGEGGRQELSTDEEGRASEEEDGLLSSGALTTATRGMPRSSEAIKFTTAEGVVTDLLISVFGSSESLIRVDVELGVPPTTMLSRYSYALSSRRRS
jgi:hypothetical protein